MTALETACLAVAFVLATLGVGQLINALHDAETEER